MWMSWIYYGYLTMHWFKESYLPFDQAELLTKYLKLAWSSVTVFWKVDIPYWRTHTYHIVVLWHTQVVSVKGILDLLSEDVILVPVPVPIKHLSLRKLFNFSVPWFPGNPALLYSFHSILYCNRTLTSLVPTLWLTSLGKNLLTVSSA